MTTLLLTLAWFVALVGVSAAEDLPHVQWLHCSDGDTCAFNVMTLTPLPAVFGTDIGVRLSGIDTPEKIGKCLKEKQLALLARDFLRSQLIGATVTIQHVFRDKYFRLEGIVIANGVNVNQLMIEKGYAVPYYGSGPRHDWCTP